MSPLARSLLATVALGSLAALAGPSAARPGARGARAQEAPLAPARLAVAWRYFDLEGEAKKDLVQNTVADFGTPQIEARILAGPMSAASRPKSSFLAFEAPAELATKDIERAFRKIGLKAEELAWTAFRGEDGPLPKAFGYSPRDLVVGIGGDLRWFERGSGWNRFYYLPGKLDAHDLQDQFRKLFDPLGANPDVGEVGTDVIAWTLPAIDAARAKRVEKALSKLAGVRRAAVDADASRLTLEVELVGLRQGAPRKASAGDAPPMIVIGEGTFLPLATFHTNAVLDLLVKEGVVVEAPVVEAR
jgi:hypothetical protein